MLSLCLFHTMLISEIVLKPLVPGKLLPCVDGSMWGLGMLASLLHILLWSSLRRCSVVPVHSLPDLHSCLWSQEDSSYCLLSWFPLLNFWMLCHCIVIISTNLLLIFLSNTSIVLENNFRKRLLSLFQIKAVPAGGILKLCSCSRPSHSSAEICIISLELQ